ncbi:MAG: hypothetical protein IPH62_19485, partial [Ignavibacteriae bacterium]|nr:hypothetical protein [Ignavibacteriota bacterium]
MDNINSLVTPDDFIQYYYKQLKTDLDVDDVNINRLGFIGFFFELLGNTQFDTKNYYNNLFAEAFPVTASNNTNLIYHSDVYGYVPGFATPSVIQGVFKFDFTSFPLIATNIKKREIVISEGMYLSIEKLNYNLDADYKIIFDRVMTEIGLPTNSFRINCEIKSKDGFEIIPLLPSNSVIKIVDLKQYDLIEESVKLTNYVFGTHYVHTIALTDFIYALDIEVKERDSTTYEKYELRQNKSFSIPDEKVIFFKVSPKNELILEFGSGINGKYIPYSDILIHLKTTKGKLGNISSNTVSPSGLFTLIDFGFNDNIITTSTIGFNPSAIEAEVYGAYDGKDAEIEEVLRENLVKYIQSRNNLMSELDFENNLRSYFDVCEILF